jgi:hypothetical protein
MRCAVAAPLTPPAASPPANTGRRQASRALRPAAAAQAWLVLAGAPAAAFQTDPEAAQAPLHSACMTQV